VSPATPNQPRVWLITGCSKGLGAAIVRAALAAGDCVVATARNPATIAAAATDSPGALMTLPLDVTDTGSIAAAVEAALAGAGRIDVLVNNAGYGLLGGIEEAADDEVRAQFDTNVFGLLAVCRAVLPVMREQRSGHVINVSSVGGFVASPAFGVYNASKFAVESITESIALEAGALGIRATVIEPGSFRTDFNGESVRLTRNPIGDYESTSGAARERAMARHGVQPGDPDRLAAAVLRIVDSADPPLRIQLGADAVAKVEAKLEAVRRDLDAWRDLATGTDLPG
jgi:NAD(P)-dependent dehydrogenase (short-subunit alcohol dehydrogenase family)